MPLWNITVNEPSSTNTFMVCLLVKETVKVIILQILLYFLLQDGTAQRYQHMPQSRSNPDYPEYQNVQSCIACEGNKDNLALHNYSLIIIMTHLLFLLHSFFQCQTHSYL